MSKSLVHRCISFLAVLVILFSTMQVPGVSVKAAPSASDLAVPLAQRPGFTINGAVHNRDGRFAGADTLTSPSLTDC